MTAAEIERLDALDDDTFRTLVEANLDGYADSKQLWNALCHTALVERTAGCLDELAEELESSITTRMLGTGHHKVKRLNAVRHRIKMVAARAKRQPNLVGERVGAYHDILRRLTLAVDTHRRACIAADLAPEPHDTALWEALDELRLPTRSLDPATFPTLADCVAGGRWSAEQLDDDFVARGYLDPPDADSGETDDVLPFTTKAVSDGE